VSNQETRSPIANEIKREKWRRANLRKKLRAGKVPTLRKPLKGAEQIYREFGIEPGVDVFLPRDGFTRDIEQRARRRYKYEKYNKSGRVHTNSFQDLLLRTLKKNMEQDMLQRNELDLFNVDKNTELY